MIIYLLFNIHLFIYYDLFIYSFIYSFVFFIYSFIWLFIHSALAATYSHIVVALILQNLTLEIEAIMFSIVRQGN